MKKSEIIKDTQMLNRGFLIFGAFFFLAGIAFLILSQTSLEADHQIYSIVGIIVIALGAGFLIHAKKLNRRVKKILTHVQPK